MYAIETLGATLPDLMLEAVLDPGHSGQLQLHTWNGRRSTTKTKLEHRGASYIPMKLTSSVVQLVRFAPPSLPYGSTRRLVSCLREFLSTYARLQPEECDLLVAFALASWFCDCMTVAPVLYLSGPDDAVSIVMRLLGCICRRSVLLSEIDTGGLATFPNGLGATLLLNQKTLRRHVKRILLASTRRHFGLLRGIGRLDVYGARAFSCENFSREEHGLMVSLAPAQDMPSFLSDADEQRIACDLQAMLLHYRMVHYREVRDRNIDCKAFVPEVRLEAHTWLAPICDWPELSRVVEAEFLRQSREVAGARLLEPKCVATEAALFFCHKPGTAHFFVGQLTETMNLLLRGRHEESTLSAKGVGSVLRELGLYGERVAEGYKIVLTDAVRARIHRLAHELNVASVQDRVRRCRFCSVEKATSKGVQ
jgi:hypothetical protein